MTKRSRASLLVCATCLIALTALTAAVESGATLPIDRWTSGTLDPVRSKGVLLAFAAITSLGADGALAGMVLIATALLATGARRPMLAPLWTTYLGVEASTYALKYAVDRQRPDLLPGVGRALSPSFPSAHSSGTAAVVGIVAVFVGLALPPGRTRVAALGVAVAIAVLLGFSRLVLNLHFLSDVLGGYLIAAFWLSLVVGRMPNDGLGTQPDRRPSGTVPEPNSHPSSRM